MESAITNQVREKILAAITENRKNYPTDVSHAVALGINKTTYSTLKGGNVDKKIKDGDWIQIARKLGVEFGNAREWKVARTPTFEYIYSQLDKCRLGSLSAMFCDLPNIGKTTTARYYARRNPHTVYVDCSQVKTLQRLIRYIAQEFGVKSNGRYADVYADLVYYLRTLDRPLIILDEAGDLRNEAFLELKALWNATEYCCGWYMMGADGFKAKLERGVFNEILGCTEMRSRYGDKYNRSTPVDSKEREAFFFAQAEMIATANAPQGTNIGKTVRESGGSLRRTYTLIAKQNTEQA